MKGSRLQEVTLEITVGAFVFMVLLGLAIFTIVISQQNLFKKTWDYSVTFPDVAGLRAGDNVYARGLLVGKVSKTTFEDDGSGVQVEMKLDQPIQLHTDCKFEISDSSLLGGKRLTILEGDPRLPMLQAADLASLKGSQPGDVMGEALSTVRMVREKIEDSRIIENIDDITAEFKQTMISINQGTGTVARLLHDDTLARDAEVLVANLKSISEGLERGEGLAGRILKDESLYNQVAGTVSNLDVAVVNVRDLSQRVADGEGLLGKVLGDDLTLYSNLVETTESARNIAKEIETGDGTIAKLIRDPSLYDDARDLMKSLNQMASNLENGEGTIGKLMQDPELYNQAKELVEEVRSTVDDLRETSPISTLSSVFFGAF